MHRAVRLLTGAALAALLATSGFAAGGGGGGGGGSMPSNNAPAYDPAADYRAGIEALQAKDFAKAKRLFDKVLRVAMRDANANYLAGLANAGLGDFKRAAKHFEKTVKAEPANISAHQQLGIAYAKIGDRPKAEGELAALQSQWKNCAETCAQSVAIKTAVAEVTAALAGVPTARIDTAPSLLFVSATAGDHAYLDAVALINERRYDDAIVALERARAAFGAHPDVLTYLGFANRKLKRFDVAEGYYRAALAIAPNHRGATEYFGELMVERGDRGGAKRMLAKLDRVCVFGCAEAEELRAWVDAGRSPHS